MARGYGPERGRFGDAMNGIRLAVSTVLLAALAACAGPRTAAPGGDAAGVTLATTGGGRPAQGVQKVQTPLQVSEVTVTVPRSLRVSEAEVFYPLADIVWRGDPRGDRYAQIEAIYAAASTEAVIPLDHGLPVVAEIEVTRFHGVTDKTRYTVGGVYALHFLLTIRDAATGEVLSGPRPVVASLPAPGGRKAIAQDYAGITQKQLVTERLTTVIREELAVLNVDPALVGPGAAD